MMKKNKRVIFTQGGKGGVGKTEVALSLASWLKHCGLRALLLDFDIENTTKSGLKNFFPEAEKFDIHRHGQLDEFYRVCQDAEVVLADMGAGAGETTFQWFEDAFEMASGLGIAFTAVGTTTNDAGSVQSILKWGANLGPRVDYLVVLNEMHSPRCEFDYWHRSPEVAKFIAKLRPQVMTMMARVDEFQAEVRNQCVTLEQIIEGEVEDDFFRYIKNVVRAKMYQKQLFEGYDKAAAILIPEHRNKDAA